jgi:hypothetical protein
MRRSQANSEIRLQHHILPDSRPAEPIPDLYDHNGRQHVLHAHLVLHHREVRSPPIAHLGCRRHDGLRVHNCHRRHRCRGLESSQLCSHRLRVPLHFLLCIVSAHSRKACPTTITDRCTVLGVLQVGSSSARSSSCPSAPKAWLSPPLPTGSGIALLVSIVLRSSIHWSPANTTPGVIVPYMIDPAYGNLGSKVFFIWGGLCACSIFWAYFFVPETRGLTLEQVDKMMGECARSICHRCDSWTNQSSLQYRRSNSSQERNMETSRQLHSRNSEEERADRAYDVGETCRVSGEEEIAMMTSLTFSFIRELYTPWNHGFLVGNQLHLTFS